MEVHPRIKTVPQVQPSSPIRRAKPHIEIASSPKPLVKEPVLDSEPSAESKHEGYNWVLILVFAFIIVMLIVLIVWLVGKTDRYAKWHMSVGGPQPQPPNRDANKELNKEQKMTHQHVMDTVSSAELDKYANLDIDPPTTPPPEKAQQDNYDMDADIKDKMETKIDAAAADSDDTSPTDAIDDAVNTVIATIEAEQNRPVEQFNLKTHASIAVFSDKDALYKANFDPEQVAAVCRGEQKSHKKFGWRYCDTSE